MTTFARLHKLAILAGLAGLLVSWLGRPTGLDHRVDATAGLVGDVLLLAGFCAFAGSWLHDRARRARIERQFRALETGPGRPASCPRPASSEVPAGSEVPPGSQSPAGFPPPLAMAARAGTGAVGCAAVLVRGGRDAQTWEPEYSAAGRSGRPGLAITPQTRFEIGSVTKVFTGLLLADMIVRGETVLDATLGDLLDVPGTAGAVTLRSLATHTSGLPRLALTPRLKVRAVTAHPDPYRGIDLAHVIAAVTRHPPTPPGTFRYSNLGYQLLGAALAAVAGETWSELIQQRICQPLGLTATGVGPDARSARGHDRVGLPVPYWDSSLLPGAGALLSTLTDLERFMRAQLVPGSTAFGPAIRLSRQSQTTDLAVRPIGLGWMLDTSGGTTVAWHNGGTGGFGAIVAIADRPRYPGGVAIMVNSPHAAALDKLALKTLHHV